jgi:glycosyltransferase involved in cell wall biosynthesis
VRVVISNSYFAPAWGYGGPTRLLYELTQKLCVAGHQVTVVTSDASDGPGRYQSGVFEEGGATIVRVPILSQWLSFKHKKFLALSYASAMRAALARADVAHLCGSRDFFVAVGSVLAARRRCPYVLAPYGSLQRGGRGWKRFAKPLFDSAVTGGVVARARFCFAQTEHEREQCFDFGVSPQKVRMIPLACDGGRFAELPRRGAVRQRLGLTDRERVVLFVGRLHPSKGVDTLVHAFRLVARRNPLARLVIVGRDDGHEAYVRRLVGHYGLGDRIIFPGPMYGSDVVGAYVDADVFALTARQFEETTLAGLEACFSGTQVVVTEQASIPWLDESGAGSTVPNDVGKISEALLCALETDNVRRRGAAARDLAYSRFEWSSVLPLYLQAYRDAGSESAL